MKKALALVTSLVLAVSLAACGSTTQEETPEPTTQEAGTEEEAETEEPTDTAEAGNVLVAYFSATGTTEGVAQTIADTLGADLYEIVPEEPYTDADLNYNDDSSRSTTEMNDPAARPAISGTVENMEDYDVIFLGYPIWWYDAPRIMSTFVESYDLEGKTIVPFCTSGGSGIGSSAANLAALTSGAEWLEGERFTSGVSQDDISAWVEELGLTLSAE